MPPGILFRWVPAHSTPLISRQPLQYFLPDAQLRVMAKDVIAEVFLLLQHFTGFRFRGRAFVMVKAVVKEVRKPVRPVAKGNIVIADKIVDGSKVRTDKFGGIHDSGAVIAHVVERLPQRRADHKIWIDRIQHDLIALFQNLGKEIILYIEIFPKSRVVQFQCFHLLPPIFCRDAFPGAAAYMCFWPIPRHRAVSCIFPVAPGTVGKVWL